MHKRFHQTTDGATPQPDAQPAGTLETGTAAIPSPPSPSTTPPDTSSAPPTPTERASLEKRLDRLEGKLDKLLEAGAHPAEIAQTQAKIEQTQAILETPASGETELEKATTQAGETSDPARNGDETAASSQVASGEPKGTRRAKNRAFGRRNRTSKA